MPICKHAPQQHGSSTPSTGREGVPRVGGPRFGGLGAKPPKFKRRRQKFLRLKTSESCFNSAKWSVGFLKVSGPSNFQRSATEKGRKALLLISDSTYTYPLIDTIHKFMYLVLNQTPLFLCSRQIGRLTSGFNWCKGLDLLFHLKPFPEKVGEKLLDFFWPKRLHPNDRPD